MHCENCGIKIEKKAQFCPRCGAIAAPETPAARKGKIRLIALSVLCAVAAGALVTLLASPTLLKPFEALSPGELLEIGDRYYRDLDYDNAAKYYERITRIEPGMAEAYRKLAESYLGLKEDDKALEVLWQAAALFPEDREIADLLSRLQQEEGDAADDGEAEASGESRGLPLEYIGQTVAQLKAAFPDLQGQDDAEPTGYVPNCVPVNMQQRGSSYAFFLYYTQYLSLDEIAQDDLNQVRCAGFSTTVGVVFPDQAGLSPDEFFAAINAPGYTFMADDGPDQGCITFEHDGYTFYINGWDIVYGYATSIQPEFGLTFMDPSIERANREFLDARY